MEQLPDGSMLVSDDSANTVLRISYSPPITCRKAGSSGVYGEDSELYVPTGD